MPQNGDIRGLVESFAAQLEALIRQSALDQVTNALGAPSAPRSGRRPGATRVARKAAGGKRTSEGVEAASEELLAYVKKNPGLRGEQIARALRTDVKTIRLPMHKLIAAKKIKTKGQRRGMTYQPA